MKTSKSVAAVCLFGVIGLAVVSRAQGPLAPPGAPAPTMRTLAQVEPRFPIASAPVTLSQPGSYYLTTNLSGRVTIASDNVTLDLMGFTIETVPHNIAVSLSGAFKNVCVRNGVIDQGDTDGIGVSFSSSESDANGRVEALRVYGGRYGIVVGDGFTVRDCQVAGASIGFRVTGNSAVRACAAERNVTGLQLLGAGAFVEDNVVRGNTNNYAFTAGNRLNLLLCEIPQTISWPCSVKFAGTLSTSLAGATGILVNASDVTIDMAGHALVGPGANSGCGIYQGSEFSNLRVSNGQISNWRGSDGMALYARGAMSTLSCVNALTNTIGLYVQRAENIANCHASYNSLCGFAADLGGTIRDCTATYNYCGFLLGGRITVIGCVATYNDVFGISVISGCTLSGCVAGSNWRGFDLESSGNTLSQCTALESTDYGFLCGGNSTLADCSAVANSLGGFYLQSGCRVTGSTAQYNSGYGILAYSGCIVSECVAEYNTGDGIALGENNNLVSRCVSSNNGYNGSGAGFHASGMGNRLEGNQAVGNDRGFDIDQGGNFIVRNTSRWNSPNWDVASGNICLVVVGTAGGAISGDSGGAALGSTDPNANFTY